MTSQAQDCPFLVAIFGDQETFFIGKSRKRNDTNQVVPFLKRLISKENGETDELTKWAWLERQYQSMTKGALRRVPLFVMRIS
jgi:hypothetical protein